MRVIKYIRHSCLDVTFTHFFLCTFLQLVKVLGQGRVYCNAKL